MSFDNKANEMFDNALQAAVLLEKEGIVHSAAYIWNVCKVVKEADTLVVNMANYITAHK